MERGERLRLGGLGWTVGEIEIEGWFGDKERLILGSLGWRVGRDWGKRVERGRDGH